MQTLFLRKHSERVGAHSEEWTADDKDCGEALPDSAEPRSASSPLLSSMPKIDVPLLREVAAVFEPLTGFKDIVLRGYFAGRDDALFAWWARRLLP